MVEKKPKLFHIASCYKIGLSNQELHRAIAFNNLHQFDLVVLSGEKEQIPGLKEQLLSNGIHHIIIPGLDDHTNPIRLIAACFKSLEDHSPTFVALSTNWHLLIFGLAKFFTNKDIKLIYSIHAFRNDSKIKSPVAQRLIGLLLFIFASLIISPSTWVTEKFKKLKNKISQIPLGISDIFIDEYIEPDFSKSLGIVFASEFRSGKNHKLLISAFSRHNKFQDKPLLNLYLPGDGPYLREIKEFSQTLGLSELIHFPGKLTPLNLQKLYCSTQLAIIPSRSETFGFCIAEPLAMGRIVISTPVGLALDYIKHGENGFIFNNENELFNIISRVSNMSRNEMLEISKNAYQVGKKLTWEQVVFDQSQQFLRLLK
jgi:glycosyltransferase involved in cell wall biosynthesis